MFESKGIISNFSRELEEKEEYILASICTFSMRLNGETRINIKTIETEIDLVFDNLTPEFWKLSFREIVLDFVRKLGLALGKQAFTKLTISSELHSNIEIEKNSIGCPEGSERDIRELCEIVLSSNRIGIPLYEINQLKDYLIEKMELVRNARTIQETTWIQFIDTKAQEMNDFEKQELIYPELRKHGLSNELLKIASINRDPNEFMLQYQPISSSMNSIHARNETIQIELKIPEYLWLSMKKTQYPEPCLLFSCFNTLFAYFFELREKMSRVEIILNGRKEVILKCDSFPWFLTMDQIIKRNMKEFEMLISTSLTVEKSARHLTNTKLGAPEFSKDANKNIDLIFSVNQEKQNVVVFFRKCNLLNTKLLEELSRLFSPFVEIVISQNCNRQNSAHHIITQLSKNNLPLASFRGSKEPETKETLLDFFFNSVKMFPQNVAIIEMEKSITYEDLDKQSTNLAQHLSQHKGNFVLIFQEVGIGFTLSVLATWKAGKICLPLDMRSSNKHIQEIIEEIRPIVLVKSLNEDFLNEKEWRIAEVIIGLDQQDLVTKPLGDWTPSSLTSSSIAFLFYTSGSTGKSKPILGPHVTYADFHKLITKEHKLGPTDRGLFGLTSPSFDVSIFECFACLGNGGTLVTLPNLTKASLRLTRSWVRDQKITVIVSSTYLVEQYFSDLEFCLPNLRLMILGGEQVRRYPDYKLNCEFGFLYGLTEGANTYSTFRKNVPALLKHVGKPMSNYGIHILDQQMYPVPKYVVGEVYLEGVHPAHQYYNRPNFNLKRYISWKGIRLLKSGDLGYMDSESNLFLVGRSDSELKIKGVRINVFELENALKSCKELKWSTIVPLDESLHVFCVPKSTIAKNQVTKMILTKFPNFVSPKSVTILSSLPYNTSGKVDKKRLIEQLQESKELPGTISSESEDEIQIAKIWKQIIGVERIMAEDNFFMLGGNSLSVYLFQVELKKAGINIPIQGIYSYPVLRDFVHKYFRRERNIGLKSLESHKFKRQFPISRSQELVLGTFRGLPPNIPQLYIESCFIHFQINLSLQKILKQGINWICQKHPILRGTLNDGNWKIGKRKNKDLVILKVSNIVEKDNAVAIQRAEVGNKSIRDEAQLGFYLLETPDEYILHVAHHHLYMDHWSYLILERDLKQFVDNRIHGRSVYPNKTQHPNYSDFVQHQQQIRITKSDLYFWITYLMTGRKANLPKNHLYFNFNSQAIPIQFSSKPFNLIQNMIKETGATLFQIIFAAFSIALKCYTNQNGNFVCLTTHGRNPESHDVIGLFINVVISKTSRIAKDDTFLKIVYRSKKELQEVLKHGNRVPLGEIVDRVPQSQIDFNSICLNIIPRISGFPVKFIESWFDRRPHAILLTLVEGVYEIKGALEYNTAFEKEAIQQIAYTFVDVMNNFIDKPGMAFGEYYKLNREKFS